MDIIMNLMSQKVFNNDLVMKRQNEVKRLANQQMLEGVY